MLDFFRGVANGAFSITTADDLWKLLTYIVNGVTSELVERSHRACRDIRRTIQLSDGCEHASPDPSPDETVERNEWWEMVLTRLNADDRRIFSMHLEGWKWTELAAQERTTAGALRMRIMRALRKAGALESEHLPLPQEEEP